jgi:hypothetical protein
LKTPRSFLATISRITLYMNPHGLSRTVASIRWMRISIRIFFVAMFLIKPYLDSMCSPVAAALSLQPGPERKQYYLQLHNNNTIDAVLIKI